MKSHGLPSGGARAINQICFTLFLLVLGAATAYGYAMFAQSARTAWVVPCAAADCALFYLFDRAMRRARVGAWLGRNFTRLTLSVAALYFIACLAFAYICRYVPAWDLDAIFSGARNWVDGALLSGKYNSSSDAATYFYYFPNNLSAMALLAAGLKLFGVADPFFSACILNCLLLLIMFLATVFSMYELGGARAGADALLLACLNLPLWLAGACFYTDILTISFPAAGFYCLLRARRGGKKARLGWLIAAGGVLALGGFFKITVLILAISAIIYLALKREWRRALTLGLATALISLLLNFALNAALYPAQLDKQEAARLKTPALHWIMMGLRDDGYYSSIDYDFTRSFADPTAREAALERETLVRLEAYDPLSYLNHALRKLGCDINSGLLQISDFYDDTPLQPFWLQRILFNWGGTPNDVYEAFCGGIHLFMLLTAMIGALRQLRNREIPFYGCLYIAYLGLLLFLQAWETNPRYTANFNSVLIMCAVCAILPIESGKRGAAEAASDGDKRGAAEAASDGDKIGAIEAASDGDKRGAAESASDGDKRGAAEAASDGDKRDAAEAASDGDKAEDLR